MRALLSSVALATIMLILFRLLFKDWRKAALADTAFLVLFSNYGNVYNLIQNHMLLGFNYGRHRILFPLFLVALVVIFIVITRLKQLPALTAGMNFLGVMLLIFPLYQIISYQAKAATINTTTLPPTQQTEMQNLELSPGIHPPDIYYIILDTYTRDDTLKLYLSYDNSSFIQELESRGFYVADCSLSNYSFTDLSLTTSLNFNYPEILSSRLVEANKDISDAYPYLSNNAVVQELRKSGYQFIALESGYSPTEFTSADVYYSYSGNWKSAFLQESITSFETLQLNTTAAMLFYEFHSYLPSQVQKILDASVVHRDRMLFELNQLEQMAALPGPKFVFVHILAPHNPFVFGPNGEYITRKTPFTLNDDRDVVTMQDYVTGYRDQVTYLNQRMLTIVDYLIQNSATPPVILIQGDHGIPRLAEWDTTILNAYYLPMSDYSELYETISPVNSFRVVFNQYFSTRMPLLADRSCNTDKNSGPFSCIPVIDPNPSCAAMPGAPNP